MPAVEEGTLAFHIVSSHLPVNANGGAVDPEISKLNYFDYYDRLHAEGAYRKVHDNASPIVEDEVLEEDSQYALYDEIYSKGKVSEYSKVLPASNLLEYAVHYYEGSREEKDMDEESAKSAIYERKLQEAKGSGLYEDIRENGVTVPIEIGFGDPDYPEGLVRDGHHRLIVAVDLGLKVPVNFSNRP